MTPRVLVVDDSALMRKMIRHLLEEAGIEVVGTAREGAEAIARTRELKPDVVTLDINMPVMDGLEALSHIMDDSPTPVVMVSSLTQEGALATLEALELGAVDFVHKPSGTISLDLATQRHTIVEKVRAAAVARVRRGSLRTRPHAPPAPPSSGPRRPPPPRDGVLAIGVSTGGPQTLSRLLPELGADFPLPVLVVQHIPPFFAESLARRLDELCPFPVVTARTAEPLVAGRAYVAPGDVHLRVARSALGPGLVAALSDRPEAAFRPSVDELFHSVARTVPRGAIGVLLTGMGTDGADGLAAIRKGGGFTVAESEETAVIYGMPRAAVERGAACVSAPLHQIAEILHQRIQAGIS